MSNVERNAKVSLKAFKEQDKRIRKEFLSLKKKLNKTQLLKLNKFQDKYTSQMTKLIYSLNLTIKVKKTDPTVLNNAIPYIKFTLLKMKKPIKQKTTGSSQGDPYTCGPEYFRRCY